VFLTLSIIWYSKNLKTQFFGTDLFPSSGEGRKTPTLLGPLEQWSSTWGTQRHLRGTQKHLKGYVKLEEKIKFYDKH
jgi:hypothetical protein